MAKIVVTFNGVLQQEVFLGKPRVTIGRRPSNDLVIDHLTISGQHAAIDTTLNGSFVIDLGSTNGTIVNGQPVKKHLLQDGDLIEIGKFKIKFDATAASQPPRFNASQEPLKSNIKPSTLPIAKIQVLNGGNAGKTLSLTKPVTTLGSPGVLVVAITREQDAYVIAHVEGKTFAKVNASILNAEKLTLKNGDQIDLAGTRMEFLA